MVLTISGSSPLTPPACKGDWRANRAAPWGTAKRVPFSVERLVQPASARAKVVRPDTLERIEYPTIGSGVAPAGPGQQPAMSPKCYAASPERHIGTALGRFRSVPDPGNKRRAATRKPPEDHQLETTMASLRVCLGRLALPLLMRRVVGQQRQKRGEEKGGRE